MRQRNSQRNNGKRRSADRNPIISACSPCPLRLLVVPWNSHHRRLGRLAWITSNLTVLKRAVIQNANYSAAMVSFSAATRPLSNGITGRSNSVISGPESIAIFLRSHKARDHPTWVVRRIQHRNPLQIETVRLSPEITKVFHHRV